MTEIEKQALALVNEDSPYECRNIDDAYRFTLAKALRRSLEMLNAEREAHAAYKREVSDAVEDLLAITDATSRYMRASKVLPRFIIKPPVDPVRLLLESVCFNVEDRDVETAKAALAARGGRIVFAGGE